MFCPACGHEESQPSQFCRACGADMRVVRLAMERPEGLREATVAREEIGHAVALKISELKGAKELAKVAEEVLPEIDKFLESPEERRLRRIRLGVTLVIVGLGAPPTLAMLQQMLNKTIPWPTGFVVFFIGLAVLINGIWFTVPRRQSLEEEIGPESRKFLNSTSRSLKSKIDEQPFEPNSPDSVTENTTKQLKKGSRV